VHDDDDHEEVAIDAQVVWAEDCGLPRAFETSLVVTKAHQAWYAKKIR